MGKYSSQMALLEWVAMQQLDGSNCKRYWLRETLLKAFENDTDEQMSMKGFMRTWTNMSECNEYIYKYTFPKGTSCNRGSVQYS